MGLKEKIETLQARVGIIGLGYVGLPLACEFVRAGFAVTGVDNDAAKVEGINRGVSHVQDVPDALLASRIGSQGLSATTDVARLASCDAVIICVPTPLRKTRDPDISYIVSAVEGIAGTLHRDMLVVLESTTYPGTTEEIIRPKLEAEGLRVGRDFYLAFSPERVDPGNSRFTTRNTPKIVGGITPQCTEMAAALYRRAVETVVPVSSTQTAEMIKLLENTFRSVNIGLVNEIALMCDRLGLDVWEVIDASATKPFGFMPFYPGPGLGGHCIPIDPHYLSWKLKTLNYSAKFIELASEINGNMPHYVVTKVVDALNARKKSVNGSRILILGVAYKKDISDVRESPALDVIQLLKGKGAEVLYHDPHAPQVHLEQETLRSVPLTDELLERSDCTVILTNHSIYDYSRIVERAQVLVDTRNATRGVKAPQGKIHKI
ncbi:MAG TPA: nucleotide sugar dehydrogenase [Candidatus Polarisedimenticolia bacterium]|nr:nucleotide sugar dehydrogenase [Candidatus Polarisedimenticolia bacterium]